MTNDRASDRDVNRAIRSWLNEDRHEDISRVAGAVLDQVETIPQRRATWWPAWRTPTMNKFVTYGLGAAAVVVLLFAGSQLFGSSSGLFGTQPSPTPKPTTEETLEPTPSSGASLPVGSSHALWDGQLGIKIHVTMPAVGWFGDVAGGILKKNDNADAPDGAAVTVFARTNDLLVGLGDLYVYGDPCHWASTKPDIPVTTVDEAIAALSAQASRDASTPVDVSYDGYAGKSITLHVPDDAVFSECDEGEFRTFAQADDGSAPRIQDDPGEFDLLTVLDVNGQIVIFDVAYYEGTPRVVLDEMAAIVESAALDYSP